jgi:hypothetical protein
MKKALKAVVMAALLGTATAAHATPSTTFWTPATTYVQPYLVPHITYDTYFAEKGMLQNDYGVTMGFLPWEKLQGEVGLDVFYATARGPGLPDLNGKPTYTKDNLYLNAKLGVPENAYSPYQPGISAGIQSVGFTTNYSNYNHLHAELGKTFEPVGNFVVGGYYGLNDKLYVSSAGKTERSGFMAAWTSPDINIKVTGLDKIAFLADYASGNNAFGAFGAGIGLFFTPAIDILTGPVWFNDKNLFKAAYGSDFMWTVQLDVDVDFAKLAKK